MAWAQPNIPGGQYTPPIPVPDGVPPPPGTIIVANGAVPPPPPGLPAAPGYSPTGAVPGGSFTTQSPGTQGGQAGFWPATQMTTTPSATSTGDAFAAAGAAGAVAAAGFQIPIIALALGAILAAFFLYALIQPIIAAFVAGGVSALTLILMGLPLLLLLGLLAWAAFGGGGGPNLSILLILAVVIFVCIPLFALVLKALPSFTGLLTPP